MASSNKTQYVNLNQWSGSDPILRSDFNEDNLKIDNILGHMPGKLLTDITTSTASKQVDIDVPLNFYSYSELKMFVYDFANTSGANLTRSDGLIRLGGRTATYYHGAAFTDTTAANHIAKFTVPANYDKAALLVATFRPSLGVSSDLKLVRCEWESFYCDFYEVFKMSQGFGTHVTTDLIGLTQINLINESGSYNFRNGMRVLLYGTMA